MLPKGLEPLSSPLKRRVHITNSATEAGARFLYDCLQPFIYRGNRGLKTTCSRECWDGGSRTHMLPATVSIVYKTKPIHPNILWTRRESNSPQKHCNCFSPVLEHASPKCNLYLSNQLKIIEVTKFLYKHIEMKLS